MKSYYIASGVLNLILAVLTYVYAALLIICTAASVILIITPLIVPAMIAAVFFAVATGISCFIALLNVISGIGCLASSFKGGKTAQAFAVFAIVSDGMFLLAGLLTLVFAVFILCDSVSAAAIIYFIMVAAAIGIAVASICVNSTALKKSKQLN